MIDQITLYITKNHLGSWASILGVITSIIGFLVTIYNVKKSKNAAELAEDAVKSLKEDINSYQTVTHFTETLAAMADIKRLHRSQEWHFLPEKCDNIRKSLINIRHQNKTLSEDDKQVIQSAIVQFRTLESSIDKYLQASDTDDEIAIDVPRNNKIVSKQIDKVHELLVRFNSQLGN